MLICSGSASTSLATKIQRRGETLKWLEIEKKRFPDGETYIRIKGEVEGEQVAVVQSMYRNPDHYLVEYLFIAKTLKDLGAKEIIGIIPYFPYARQDARFNPGEAVTFDLVKELIEDSTNKLLVVDIHQHRRRGVEKEFRIPAKNLSAAELFIKYAEENMNNPFVVGPDDESVNWVSVIARKLSAENTVFRKKRVSPEEVELESGKLDLRQREVLIVDDIISTGETMAKAVETVKGMGASRVVAACTHPILVKEALKKIYRAGADIVIGTDTVPSEISFFSVSGIIARELR